MSNPIRIRRIPAFMCLLFALAACTAPSPGTAPPSADAPEAAAAEPAAQPAAAETAAAPAPAPAPAPAAPAPSIPPAKAPRMSDPMPPEQMPSPVTIDYSCRTDADCTVKNVGNCCGMMPACINKASPTDPAAVQAECKRQGMSSVCGFREIAACSCVNSRCEGRSSDVATH